MKDRLLEDLKAFRTPICEGLNAKLSYAEELADYLLSSGVIKELTEENARLRSIQLHVCVGDVISPEKKEELRVVAGHKDPVGEPCECGLRCKCQVDTVRKMHSEIEARCIKGGIYPAFVASTIDQIAKEMIEGVTENG